ncbi:hypothetical protein HDV02_003096 [Globomyces sp. JEL0801]|nr:hypothetical protein HDV02_003096 [Globomyces sp. JEL0801]
MEFLKRLKSEESVSSQTSGTMQFTDDFETLPEYNVEKNDGKSISTYPRELHQRTGIDLPRRQIDLVSTDRITYMNKLKSYSQTRSNVHKKQDQCWPRNPSTLGLSGLNPSKLIHNDTWDNLDSQATLYSSNRIPKCQPQKNKRLRLSYICHREEDTIDYPFIQMALALKTVVKD